MILNKFAAKSIILAMTSAIATTAFADGQLIDITINNTSGQKLYLDITNSPGNTVYSFANQQLESTFNNQIGQDVIELKEGANVIKVPTTTFAGGARINVSVNQFTDNMTQGSPGKPNLATYPYLYDKIETGWNSAGTAGWNTTSVDFFGFPMQLSFTNGSSDKVGFCSKVNIVNGKAPVCSDTGNTDVTRQLVIENLEKNLEQQSNLYDQRFFYGQDASGDPLRIFSPLHFYTSLVSPVWTTKIDNDLETLGKLGSSFNFNYGSYSYSDISYNKTAKTLTVHSGGDTITLSDITVGNAAGGKIIYSPNTSAASNFAGMIAAAINRGVLADPTHWGENGGTNEGYPQYYYPEYPNNIANNPTYNLYSATLIPFGLNGKLYANSYDDFWHMDSSLQVGPSNYQNGITITILPFKSGTPSQPTITWNKSLPNAIVTDQSHSVDVTMPDDSASVSNSDPIAYLQKCMVVGDDNASCSVVPNINSNDYTIHLSNLNENDSQYQVTAYDLKNQTIQKSSTGKIEWKNKPGNIIWPDNPIEISNPYKGENNQAYITWQQVIQPVGQVNYTYCIEKNHDTTTQRCHDKSPDPEKIIEKNLDLGTTYTVTVKAEAPNDQSSTVSKDFTPQSSHQGIMYYGETGTAPASIQDEDGNVLVKFSSTESKQFTLPKGKPVIAVYQGGKCQITAHTSEDAESLLINNGVPVHFPPCPINFNTTAHAGFITMQFPS
ncbi:beta-1,3-glucanase family protein [Thiotrichales bacterium 19X7-9]|nr:beta-1,3-glucanase family protein [Thiotrichales bacterium 19X7-9]